MNNTSEVVCVCSPFKTGSTTIANTLRRWGITVIKTHDSTMIQERQIRLVILPVRDPNDIYTSAFFQDILEPSYPYCVSPHTHIVSALPMNALVAHFRRFAWRSYPWLNYNTYLSALEKRLERPITCNFVGDYAIHSNGDFRVVLIRTGAISVSLAHVMTEVMPSLSVTGRVEEDNSSTQKWYAQIYKDFKSALAEV